MLKKASLINLVDLLLIVMVAYLVFAPKAEVALASHVNNMHNFWVHYISISEWVCVDTSGATGITFTTARNRVKNTLRYDNTSSDWHALAPDSGSYRIYFEFETISCGSLSSGRLSQMRGRVYVQNTTSLCPNPAYSCTLHYSSVNTHGGATDYAYEKVFLNTTQLNGTTFTYHHTVSHEFGHMLGLADGGSNGCTESIMHPPVCLEWPTSSDRTSVTNIAMSYNTP